MPLVYYLNIFLGLGAILLQVFSVVTLCLLLARPKKNFFLDLVSKHYLLLGFGISFLASAFTLVYSEIVGYVPCYLCWYQRAFMFPLPFIFGMALWYKDRNIIKYVLPLLSVGFVIAAYQSFMYYFVDTGNIPCDASGVSCYQHLIDVFGGWISFPMLSLASFFALMMVVLSAHFYKREE